jgi:glutamate dehydrogenase (NADP+)
MLNYINQSVYKKTVVISGSGNVAQFAAEKCIQLSAKVVTLSDSSGFIYDKEGINKEKLNHIMDLKNNKRVRISEYLNKYPKAKFYKNKTPWNVPCDIALPCATQNELNKNDAEGLIEKRMYLY